MGICIKAALRIIEENVKKVSFEIIPIENAQTRICAQDVFAKHSLPNYNNSAMDGYALIFDDNSNEFEVTHTILAGSNIQPTISKGTCVKIMTGARVPSSASAVVPIELVEHINNTSIKISSAIKHNQHIRFIGEDIKENDHLLHDGDEINFATITILASQGITHIKVYRQPKIAVFTSGDELKLHYEQIEDYQIYNSNTPTLLARSKELGANVTFVGMSNDDVDSLKEMIVNSLDADLIITSGGVSVGDADFTKEAFNSFDMETFFDGITIKPGKPTVFGKINDTLILNLPGNPLAAALIFEVFGKSILQILTGNKNIYHNTLHTKISQDLPNKKGRTTIIPGFFDGEFFTPSAKRLPGMVGVLHNCNSLMILDKHQELIPKDSSVKILPINWKFFTNKPKDFFN